MLREFWDMNCCRTDVCLMRVRGGHCSQGSQAGEVGEEATKTVTFVQQEAVLFSACSLSSFTFLLL